MDRELLVAQTGGYITARTCSLFGKEAVKTFFYKCSDSGKMNPLHSKLMGTMGTKLYGQ